MRWTSTLAALAALLLLAAPVAAAEPVPTLKDAYAHDFLIGAALNPKDFDGRDRMAAALVAAQFSAITPGNVMKWALIHPRPGVYDFAPADRFVAFGEAHGLAVIGHNLVWHNQVPDWVFQDDQGRPLTREALLQRLHDHIFAVVGRYKGRIKGWDVVNEALTDDGALRPSPWLKIIGPDYLEMAFRWAHEADPAAELYYNDFSLERPEKRRGALALVARLKAEGVPITGVGLQNHDRLDWPSLADEDATISAFGALGMKVSITELDIDVLPKAVKDPTAEVSLKAERHPGLNPWPDGLPHDVQAALAQRYAGLFGVFLKHRDVVERVTFWGVDDGDSWLNDWPVLGRTSYPLLFDRDDRPKPAFFAVIRAAGQPPVQ
jgi:endo-1,4-beta-xylanase